MFGKQKQGPQAQQAAKPKVELTLAEKREIRKIMEAARGDGKAHSAQDTLPFRQMYPDGLCKLDDNSWSKCIEFEDVNYQLAKPDDQTAIFEALCDMYNAHDASIGMELSLVSRRMNREDFVKRIEIAAQGDNFDHIRELYTQMLRKQLEKGNNGLVKTKYLTLTIEAKDIKTARARFSRIILDALNHFKVMGALAKELSGKEWLEVLHGILHPDGERFSFEWGWLAPSGLHVKDFISPSSFRFGEARRFRMADKFCAVSFLQISAPEMDDRLLTELLDTDSGLLVSLHIRSMDQNEAIKTVKRKITDIDSNSVIFWESLLSLFCDANFEGGICCNPGSNPATLRIQGITAPEDRNFVFHDPAPQALKLPALRAVVAEQGAFTTPALGQSQILCKLHLGCK